MRRGDIVLASAPGDYGKPRPYVNVQTDVLVDGESVLLCPVTSDVRGLSFRVAVTPTRGNGLNRQSEIMVDKVLALPRMRVRAVVGALDDWNMVEVDAALRLMLAL